MEKHTFDYLETLNLKIQYNEPMSRHTSFKIGGNAQCMITPKDKKALVETLKFIKAKQIPLFVMGSGTNLLVSDEGIEGIVLNMSDGIYCLETFGEQYVIASSGMKLSRIAVFAMNNHLSGMEFAHGIPGSLGGAVYMNAGAYGGEMKQIVVKTKYLDENGEEFDIRHDEHEFSYRRSFFTNKNAVILGSVMKLTPSDAGQIYEKMNELKKQRKEKQPLEYPSAGSAFKRPEGHYAGQLIEACGLKGYSVGKAMVSTKHAGFIINTGNATAKDVKNLIEHIQNEVMKKFQIHLESEIKMVGSF